MEMHFTESGYYVDFFRSDNDISNDYINHNIGHGVTLTDMLRNPFKMHSDSIPYQACRQSGMAWFDDIKSPEKPVSGAIALFRVEEENQDDVFMQMLMPLHPGEKVFTAIGPRSRTAPSGISDLPTPKTVIHRPESAWVNPFRVIYEPYRGEDGYTVISVKRLNSGSSMAALEVENKDGSRQMIMQSDKTADLHLAGNISIRGHYGVISVSADNKLHYMYLGHGQAIGWNGFHIESTGTNIASFVEFKEDSLRVSTNGQITLQFPYLITEVKDHEGNRIDVKTDPDSNTSFVTFSQSADRKFYLSGMNKPF